MKDRASARSRAATASSARASNAIAMRRCGAELIGQHGELRALDVLKEQRRAAGLDDAVGDLGDFEARIDLRGRSCGLRRRAAARRQRLAGNRRAFAPFSAVRCPSPSKTAGMEPLDLTRQPPRSCFENSTD